MIALRLACQSVALLACAVLGIAAVWGAERVRERARLRIWKADLTTWVGRLSATRTGTRDSAVLAVSELLSRAWQDANPPTRSVDVRSSVTTQLPDSLRAALVALACRLTDTDSSVRAHAVSAVLDVTEGRPEDMAAEGAAHRSSGREPLRNVARQSVGELIRSVAIRRRPPEATLAAFEVLFAIGAPADLSTAIRQIAMSDASPTVREFATVLADRPASPSASLRASDTRRCGIPLVDHVRTRTH